MLYTIFLLFYCDFLRLFFFLFGLVLSSSNPKYYEKTSDWSLLLRLSTLYLFLLVYLLCDLEVVLLFIFYYLCTNLFWLTFPLDWLFLLFVGLKAGTSLRVDFYFDFILTWELDVLIFGVRIFDAGFGNLSFVDFYLSIVFLAGGRMSKYSS